MKEIVTKIGKSWRTEDWYMPESRTDGKPILLLADDFEDLLLEFANKGEVEITIQLKRKRTKK